MTVKTLLDEEKTKIGQYYTSKAMTQKEMAAMYEVSERTIKRVIDEQGLSATLPRMTPKASKIMELLRDYKMDLDSLEKILKHSGAPTKEKVVQYCMYLPEEEFGSVLSEIITARVARAYNTHVQTAMLNLQQKVDANALENSKPRSKK